MGATEILADYIVKSKLSDFPTEVVKQAKNCIQDTIGCAIGGAQTELGKRHIEIAKDLGGKPEATLIGDGAKVSCVFAAHANAELGNVLDFDDIDWLSLTHPGSPIVTSAFAVGEMMGASGDDILTSVIVGYEVGLRVARAIRSVVARPDGEQEVMSNPSYLVFASAAAAGKILGLRAEQVNHAFGLAGSTPINRGQSRVHLGALTTHPYAENKYDLGIYPLIGVFSAIRARRISGPKNILDGDRFWTRASATAYDTAELTRGLGAEYRIMETGFKPVCFCGCTMPPISAVREALKGEVLNSEDIKEIKLIGIPKLEYKEWDTMVDAEFSVPCAVALAVTGEEPGPDWFKDKFKNADIFEVASKVSFVEDPKARQVALEKGQWMCSVEIRTKGGKVIKGHADSPIGSPWNPMTEEELHHKFIINAKGILGKRGAETLWKALLNLEKARRISDITARFAKAD